MSNSNNFWNRSTADRLAARRDIMAACGDFGESFAGGLRVVLRKGERADVERAAAAHDLRVVGQEWTVVPPSCRTVLALELA